METAAVRAEDALLFLNRREASTVDALASEFIPSEDGSPGATEAGVTTYIDRALAGFMRDLQHTYRRGLMAVDALSVERVGTAFSVADPEQRKQLMGEMDGLARNDADSFVGQFFRIVREHTIQGFFGDPVYGGNRDTVGWRLVGFPGAQWGYSAEQMRPGVDSRTVPILTVGDLYARIGEAR